MAQNDSQRIAALELRISELEALVKTMRKNSNNAIAGHAAILESLVNHTSYVPPAGRKLVFPRTPVDIGSVI